MRIQVIDEHGTLRSDHPVGIHIDPDHGLCDLCEKHTPVLFDVTIYPADDYPILRCHGCIGDGSPGERLVGVATAQAPDSHDIYVIDPHRYLRLKAEQAQTVAGELAEHLPQVPQRGGRPQPGPLRPQLAQMAEHPGLAPGTAGQPTPTAADQPPAPTGSQALTVPRAPHRLARADELAISGRRTRGSAAGIPFDLVGPHTPGQAIWHEPATAAPEALALVIGDPSASAYVVDDLAGLERFVGALMARLRAERVASADPHEPAPAVTVDPAAVRTWLVMEVIAHDLAGDYTPEANIAAALETLIHELGRDTHPRVWRLAPDISDVIVRPTAHDESDRGDFGGVLTVNVGAVHLVTHPLSASDLTGLHPDATEPPAMPWIDALHRAITVAAGAVNDVVARWRFATGQYLPHGQDELAYDGWSNNPPKRPLTARERDILVRILRDVAAAATSPTPISLAVAPAELHLLAQVREALDPRTD